MAALQQHMPDGYHITQCCTSEGVACGCYTALKRKPSRGWAACKVHGPKADHGASDALQAVRDAGYKGPVLTQFPLFSEGTRRVSRKQAKMSKKQGRGRGGQFNASKLKVDMMFCNPDVPCFVALEVQGTDHCVERIVKRDVVKQCAVESMQDCFHCFAMHTSPEDWLAPPYPDQLSTNHGIAAQIAQLLAGV